MRALPAAALALALLAFLAFPVAAQDPDGPPGCVEANPCDIIIAVDADGFADLSDTEFTAGDWYVATVVNHDEDAEHTISLAGHSMTLTVPAGDVDDTQPFRMGAPGQYALVDQPSGDTAQWTSVAGDDFEDGQDGASDDDSSGIPGLAPALLALALVAVAVVARRGK